VRAIRLRPEDRVVGVDVAGEKEDASLLIVTEKGLGKRTPLSSYNIQKRGGLGVKTLRITSRTGKLVGAHLVKKKAEGDLLITSKQGQVIRLPLKSVPSLSRVTQGVTLMKPKANDTVASFALLLREEELEKPPQLAEEVVREEKGLVKSPTSGEKKEKKVVAMAPPKSGKAPEAKKTVKNRKQKSKPSKSKKPKLKSKPKAATSKPKITKVKKFRQKLIKGFSRKKLKKVKKTTKSKPRNKRQVLKGGFRLRRL